MTSEDRIAQIKSDLPKLKNEFGVNRIGLFGSYATNNVHAKSDLDFLVELNPPYVRNYFDLLFFLENKFGKKVDLIRRSSHLREKFIQHIEKKSSMPEHSFKYLHLIPTRTPSKS